MAVAAFISWMARIFATDGGALSSARRLDFALFPLVVAIAVYLIRHLFSAFIATFCLLGVACFFLRGCLPTGPAILRAQRRRRHKTSMQS